MLSWRAASSRVRWRRVASVGRRMPHNSMGFDAFKKGLPAVADDDAGEQVRPWVKDEAVRLSDQMDALYDRMQSEDVDDRGRADADRMQREGISDEDVARAVAHLKTLGGLDALLDTALRTWENTRVQDRSLIKPDILRGWRKQVTITFCSYLGALGTLENLDVKELSRELDRMMALEALRLLGDDDDRISLLCPSAPRLGFFHVVDDKDCELMARAFVKNPEDSTIELQMTWQTLSKPASVFHTSVPLKDGLTVWPGDPSELFDFLEDGARTSAASVVVDGESS